jgi:hypothetical protein
MLTCFYCYSEIDSRATHCPHCRNPQGAFGRAVERDLRRQLNPNPEPVFYGHSGPWTLEEHLWFWPFIFVFAMLPTFWFMDLIVPGSVDWFWNPVHKLWAAIMWCYDLVKFVGHGIGWLAVTVAEWFS